MTLSKFRSKLYALVNILGDVQAVAHKKPAKAIPKRIGRRIAGKITGRLMGGLFPPTRWETDDMTHLYQLCHNARRMDRHSEAELWARFKAVRPQDACAVTPARPAPHPMPEQIDAALEWARKYLLTR